MFRADDGGIKKLGRRLVHSFNFREFRWYWFGSTLAIASFRIQEVVLGWQMLEATNSALWVGAIAFANGLPLFLVSPFAGLLADRFRRQRLVFFALILAAGASASLSALTAAHLERPTHLLATSFALGTSFALYAPARLALLPTLVPRNALLNASTLEYATTRFMGFVGPLLAGSLAEGIGIPLTLLVQMTTFIFAALVFMSSRLATEQMDSLTENRFNVFRGLVDVLAYLRSDPPLFGLMILSLVMVPFGMTHTMLMQVFVRDVLDGGPALLGLILGLSGLGSAISGLLIAAIGDTFRKGRAVLWSSALFGLTLIVFAYTDQPEVALIVMFSAGLISGVYLTLSNVLFQSEAPNPLRGRVLSVWGMVWGLIPFVSLAGGALAEQFGIRIVFACSGAICTLGCVKLVASRSQLLDL